MKRIVEEIKSICESKLKEMFPQGIPTDILDRYRREMQFLEYSKSLNEFTKLYACVMDNPNEAIFLKGTMPGSFLSFLIRGNGYIPMDSPYYYCSECGYYEPIYEWKNCIDAPNVCCPKCGKLLKAQGFSCQMESVWGLDGKKAIGFEKEDIIHPFVEKRLNQLIKEFEPQSFEDKINLCACASDIYFWEKVGDGELDFDRFKSFIFSEEFKACKFFTREELYENLCAKDINPTNAYRMSEFVRKGCVVKIPSEIQKYEIPEEVVSVAQNICYLESRAHAIQTAYRYWMRCTEK